MIVRALDFSSDPVPDIPHDLSVDGARDAVLELQVHLGDSVLGEDGGVRDITCAVVSRDPPGW